mgnify:CR=1 FL=1
MTITLDIQKRDTKAESTKSIREAGEVPAVFYGPKEEAKAEAPKEEAKAEAPKEEAK